MTPPLCVGNVGCAIINQGKRIDGDYALRYHTPNCIIDGFSHWQAHLVVGTRAGSLHFGIFELGANGMLHGSSILVTGGTGSFGHAFVAMTLAKYDPERLVILSRDEMKQWEMAKIYGTDKRVRFFIGDVRDKDRLSRALDGIDFVVHAAATKIVPTAEYNPFECVKTNIHGAMNVIDACLDRKVKRVIALSTDKASSPLNLYGATKLASDKLFVAANSYSGSHGTVFGIVRYGNVMGSRGSVIPFFQTQAAKGKLPITDLRMTRFMITLEQAVELVWHAFEDMVGGEIYIKKIPSMNLLDIAEAVAPNVEHDIIGIRPGEKLHEQMIGEEDAPYTYDYGYHFKILPTINNCTTTRNASKQGDQFQKASLIAPIQTMNG